MTDKQTKPKQKAAPKAKAKPKVKKKATTQKAADKVKDQLTKLALTKAKKGTDFPVSQFVSLAESKDIGAQYILNDAIPEDGSVNLRALAGTEVDGIPFVALMVACSCTNLIDQMKRKGGFTWKDEVDWKAVNEAGVRTNRNVVKVPVAFFISTLDTLKLSYKSSPIKAKIGKVSHDFFGSPKLKKAKEWERIALGQSKPDIEMPTKLQDLFSNELTDLNQLNVLDRVDAVISFMNSDVRYK